MTLALALALVLILVRTRVVGRAVVGGPAGGVADELQGAHGRGLEQAAGVGHEDGGPEVLARVAGGGEVRAAARGVELPPAEPEPDPVLGRTPDPRGDFAGGRPGDHDPPLGEVRLPAGADRVVELSGYLLGDPHQSLSSTAGPVERRYRGTKRRTGRGRSPGGLRRGPCGPARFRQDSKPAGAGAKPCGRVAAGPDRVPTEDAPEGVGGPHGSGPADAGGPIDGSRRRDCVRPAPALKRSTPRESYDGTPHPAPLETSNAIESFPSATPGDLPEGSTSNPGKPPPAVSSRSVRPWSHGSGPGGVAERRETEAEGRDAGRPLRRRGSSLRARASR